MPPPPPQVKQWLRQTYPRPTVDPEWLEACYSYVTETLPFDPSSDMDAVISNVDAQLLESDLADSMVPGTGIPPGIVGAKDAVLKGPVLLQITSMVEIGHSAYSLLQAHEARTEWHRQVALRNGAPPEEGEDKPLPKYPRSMLRLELSDGHNVLPAIEFRSLPELELGETPLGYKLILKDVTIHSGIARLKPNCVDFRGHRNEDLDANRERDLLRSLRTRLGETVDEDNDPPAEPAPAPAPAPRMPPAAAPAPAARPAARPPLRNISPPPDPGPSNAPHDDDAGQPRRRKVPNRAGRTPSPVPPPRRSRYFPNDTANAPSNPSAPLAQERLLSPRAAPVAEIADSDEEAEAASHEFTFSFRAPRLASEQTLVNSLRSSVVIGKQREATPPPTPTPPEKPGSQALAREATQDYFDGDDDGFSSASFLAQVDRVEQEAFASLSASQAAQSQTQVKMEVSTQQPVMGRGRSAGATDVICISDEENEKENVPAPTRHVRRRTAPRPRVDDGDVIELSD